MRKRIYQIIEVDADNDVYSKIYDVFMMLVIFISLAPLATKEAASIFNIIEIVTVSVFLLDYIVRWFTADLHLKKGIKSFFIYPFTLMALIDLFSMLPSITIMNGGFKVLKVVRLLKTLRVLRVFKAVRYSKNIKTIINVIKKQKNPLSIVGIFASGYILVCALIMFNVEPDTFPTFFDAVYWATVSLTTVGYGDIYAVSVIGKIITMISSMFGIAIVALPAGIISAGYMAEIRDSKNEKKDEDGIFLGEFSKYHRSVEQKNIFNYTKDDK